MEFQDIVYEKKESIAIARLNRPERLNALRQDTLRELLRILEDSSSDESVRILILTGTGRAFCAGEDLKEFDPSMSTKEYREHVLSFQEVTRQMVNHPKIIITALNGLAVGAGAEIPVAGDVRIASEKASLAFVEAKRALFPTNGVLHILPRLVGHGRALEMLVTGRVVTAQEALAAGLVTCVVLEEKLMEFTLGLAQTIGTNAPITVRLIKQALRRSPHLDLEAVMQLEVDGCIECHMSQDEAEGVLAFLEKRPPVYTGK